MRGVQVGPFALTRAPGEAFGAQYEIQCFQVPAADNKRHETWPRSGFTQTAAGAEANGNCEDVVKHGVPEATWFTSLVNGHRGLPTRCKN